MKYAIVKIYSDKTEGEHYATADDVHEKIKELFDVKIPHVVIAKTVLKLSLIENSTIGLKVFEQGNTFQIMSARFDEDEVTYQERESVFNQHLMEIEAEYKAFIEREGTCDDKVTFTEFISKNTDNILGYFENDSETQVEEEYTSMVFFLEYLHRDNNDLYKVANQLFWGSVIAAFLQSDRPNVHDEERGSEAEYYLDTSIAMGLLDLSTPENEMSARDVCDIIKSSGSRLKIHPATIEEMKTILSSVAQNGAYPGTGIANACSRRNLLAPEITKILVNLQKELEDKGVQVFPLSMPDCRRQVMNKYRGKSVLRELAFIRNDNNWAEAQSVYFSDQFREAHDIFMDDYIKEQRKVKNGRDNVYFLTTNKDLITFCKNRHPEASYMMSTSKVILELWMHNAQPSNVSASILTETMARCLDLHRSKVRTKLHEVAKFFNRNKEDVAPEVYNEFLRLLYRRARKVVAAVEQIPEDDSKAFMQKLQEAIKEDQSHFDAVNSKMNLKNTNLEGKIAEQEKAINGLSDVSERKSQTIGSLKDKNEAIANEKDKLNAELTSANKAVESAKEEAATERRDKEAAQLLNKLYAERDELNSKLVQMRATLSPLEKDRQKSFCNWQPTTLVICGVVLVLIFGALVVLDKLKVYEVASWVPYVTLVTLACALIGAGVAINTEDRRNRRKEKAFAKWEKVNSAYKDLMEQIAELENDLQFCKNQIKNSTAQK